MSNPIVIPENLKGKYAIAARKANTLKQDMAILLAELPEEDQDLFLFEAQTFTKRTFQKIINNYRSLTEEEEEYFRQILDDLYCAFEEWDAWTGNKGSVEEQDEFQEMVAAARERVLRHIHKIR